MHPQEFCDYCAGAYHQNTSQGSVPGGAGRTSQPAPGIVVNRCVATVKSWSMPVILINTTKKNVWLQQPLLAAELYSVEYHPVEHWAYIEVQRDAANVSFLPVVPQHHQSSSGTG